MVVVASSFTLTILAEVGAKYLLGSCWQGMHKKWLRVRGELGAGLERAAVLSLVPFKLGAEQAQECCALLRRPHLTGAMVSHCLFASSFRVSDKLLFMC